MHIGAAAGGRRPICRPLTANRCPPSDDPHISGRKSLLHRRLLSFSTRSSLDIRSSIGSSYATAHRWSAVVSLIAFSSPAYQEREVSTEPLSSVSRSLRHDEVVKPAALRP